MKKLMTLLAVIAVCGAASAAISWDTSLTGNAFTLTLNTSEAARAVQITGMTSSVAGSWSLTSLDAGFDTARNTGVVNAGNFYNIGGTAAAPAGVAAGSLLTITFTANDLTGVNAVDFGFLAIGAGNSVTNLADVQTAITGFNVPVPEPITMALMGLGGLFIRRRRA